MDCIGQFDRHEARRMGWHNKTNVIEDLSLEKCFLATQYELKPVSLHLPDGSPAICQTDEETGESVPWTILGCTDNPKVQIGAPYNPTTFKPFSNRELLDIVSDAISGTGHEVESVLSCCNRGKVAISIQLSELPQYAIGDRVFELYLSFLLGRDMGQPLIVKTGNTCVVCKNTFDMALSSGGKLVNAKVKQTKNSRKKIANMQEIIGAAVGVQAQFKAQLEALAAQGVKHSEAKSVFTGFLMPEFDRETIGDTEAEEFEIATRTGNRVDRLLELFHDDSKGNMGRSRADLFSAGTDYYTHESAGKDVWKQLQSSTIGSAANEKARLWAAVSDPQAYEITRSRGEAILALC